MKKVLFIFVALLTAFAFASCSSESFESKSEISSFHKNDQETNVKTVEELKKYNETLLTQCAKTRGRGRKLYIAASDICGAAAGISAGKEFAGLVGAVTGGTGAAAIMVGCALLVGASASYYAYYSTSSCSYSVNTPELLDYATKIVRGRIVKDEYLKDTTSIKNNNQFETILDEEAFNRINLPQEYSYLQTLGADHNALIVDSNVGGDLPNANNIVVSDNNLNKVELAPDDIARFEQVFDQQEFKDYYYETLENVKNNNDLNNISDCPENVKKALVNYLELFNEYPENVDELVEIANGYIDIIEKNNEFSKDEKDMIYAAIMVSVYSPQLWYNFK